MFQAYRLLLLFIPERDPGGVKVRCRLLLLLMSFSYLREAGV